MRKYFYIGDSLSVIFTANESIALYDIEAFIQGTKVFTEKLNDTTFRMFVSEVQSKRITEGSAPILITLSEDVYVKSGKNIDLVAVSRESGRPIDGMSNVENMVLNINKGDITFDLSLAHFVKSPYQFWIESGFEGTQKDFEKYLRDPAVQAGAQVLQDYAEWKGTALLEINSLSHSLDEKILEATSVIQSTNLAKNSLIDAAGEADVAAGLAREAKINADQAAIQASNSGTYALNSAQLAGEKAQEARMAAIEAQNKAMAAHYSAIYANTKGLYANQAAEAADQRAEEARLAAIYATEAGDHAVDQSLQVDAAIEATNFATGRANDAAILANEKAGLANTSAQTANSAATLANEKAGLANAAAINANAKAGIANTSAQTANNAAALANEAAITANNAADTLLSNVISLEIRDDMHLYMTTPDVYSGFMFKIENGSLIAII